MAQTAEEIATHDVGCEVMLYEEYHMPYLTVWMLSFTFLVSFLSFQD